MGGEGGGGNEKEGGEGEGRWGRRERPTNSLSHTQTHALTHKPLSLIFKEIVEAVAALHRLNVAHRDIKPENILFPCPLPLAHTHSPSSPSSRVKLCDFAFAQFDGQLREECGTPEYQAPETMLTSARGAQPRPFVMRGPSAARIAQRQQCYTKLCDMWSLGAVLYLILSGTLPFSGSSSAEAKLTQQYEFDPEAWGVLSRSARQCVCVLLCGPPRLRATAERLLTHPWITQEDGDLSTAPLPYEERRK